MIYIFDKTQSIIKVLTNDDFTAAHLNFKINTATTFEFSLPASKALPSDSKYVATPHPLDDSKFIMLRLTERVDNTETIDYSAYELAYQELATDGYIEDKRPQNQSALNLMKIALDGSNWELNNVNVSGAATTNFYYVDRLSAISKVVDLLGGEIVFYIEIQGNAISGRYMDYLARQGADTSKVFASGSNLLTVERQSDTSGIYTAILPRGKGKEIDNGDADTPDGYGRRINIADVEWKKSSGKPLDKPKGSIVLSDPDATAEWGQINGNARLLLQTYDDIDDVNVLINSAYKTLQSVNHPQIQYSATVADVGGLSLGDTVLIMHGDRDLSYKTRVFEVKYDLLAPDQTELSLGDDLSSNSITSQINNLNAVADTTSSQTQWTINQIGRPGTTYGATAPDSPKVGDIWFKYLPDGGTEIYRWNGDIWEFLVSPKTADDIDKAVDDAVAQANAHTDEVKQGLSTDIATAKSQAASLASEAQQNAIDVASKSLGTYLVRLLPGTNIFKTTNSTTIQAQVWKAGQDITSTLDNASFSWKIAKDGATAVSLTNNVKSVTAKPTDFINTGTYSVNVVIPVTDTTGTTRNQTFSDSTTIAKVADGVNGTNGQNGEDGADGNGILSTTITYATSASGTIAPTSGYTSTIPTVNKGQFLWQRTATSYTNGTTKNSDVVTYFAKDGLNGVDGMDGGQGMIAQPTKPTSGLVNGFLWLDTSQTYPVYYVYDGSIKDFKIYQFNAKNINADQLKAKFVGTDRLSASQIIADDLHVQSANIDGKLTASQITVSSTDGAQTSLANFNLWEMSQTISDTKNAVNNLGQVNQLFNTEFSPDGRGWIVGSGWGPSLNVPIWNSSYVYSISSSTGTSYLEQSLPVTAGTTFSLSANLKTFMSSTDTGTVNLFAIAYDSTGNALSTLYYLTINQTLDFSNYKRENLVTPTGTSTIRFGIVKRGTISAYINQPMLVFASTVGSYVQGNYNNNAALAQVKITADGINNFVRDSSGNISSDFQTALSKTSIITGSALATSIQKQTATQITQALTDNNGKIISLINQDTSGVQIAGKNIVLDGNVTVTNAFTVGQANIANGAIGTAQIGDAAITSAKIATIDASKITTGTLTGVNVTVDKNLTMGTSGVMTWALSGSWRDYSFDPYYVYYRQDGNPNQYYVNTVQTGSLTISASNTGGSLTFNGSITAPNAASGTKSYYMYYPSDISTGTNTLYTRVNMGIGGVNVSSWGDLSNRGKDIGGYTSIGPTGLVATQNLNNLNSYVSVDGELGGGRLDLFYDFSKFSLAGNSASFRYTTANNLQISAPAGIDIGGGTLTKIGSDTTASILLRSDSGGNAVVSTDVYARTYSYASNMYVTSAGTIGRATSASKYKLAITHYDELDRANKLLSIKPARWFDKAETEQYVDELNGGDGYGEHLPVKPHFGLIAEDLVEAGLEEFVSYGADGQVEGLEYDRVWTTLIPLIKNMKERIEELERKVA